MIDATPPLPRFVSLNDAMRVTALSRSAIYRLISSGELRRVKAGGKVVFTEANLRQWMESRVAEATQRAVA